MGRKSIIYQKEHISGFMDEKVNFDHSSVNKIEKEESKSIERDWKTQDESNE